MYLITVKTIEGNILTFKLKKYTIKNNLISFEGRDGLEKHFPIERSQIEEIRQESEY